MATTTETEVAGALRYDQETGVLVWRERPSSAFPSEATAKSWNSKHANKPAFTAPLATGHLTGRYGGKTYLSHRVIWLIMTGEWPDGCIDHINGDPSDNRWQNLRCVSHAENCRNQKRRTTNTSGKSGVCWDKRSKRWRVRVSTKHIGDYRCIAHAIKARNLAAEASGYHKNHDRVSENI